MQSVYDNILIVGGGLIGSSIARACREFGAAERVTIADTNADVRKSLRGLDVCEDVTKTADPSDADLVILAVPPGIISDTAAVLLPTMKKGATLTDVGSVKADVVEKINTILPEGIYFIGGHPISGTEQSGPEAGFASLFSDRWCILTTEDEASPSAQKLKKFWQAIGSRVAFMDAKHHDLVLATTSHLPHLIAYALVGTATDMETVTRGEVVKYSAGGFRDFTRIAASDPVMWRDVFLQNKDAV
ncbi:prephenate dehydrogenase/arogenate dehydrogenase family protein, partial [bacterium AH-315-J23]|nr:prephenate dehydrogenase/arogenate dehydrogenase family protein [bacterium AH-315-J23]